MATLILTAVGSAVGGPIGGAIGAVIGQQVDNMLFAPKGRQGPRLKELEVQTSSYGIAIPAIFGAMRVAGTVIWATDLIERRSKSGGGKGKPSTTNYSYSVSMAVAISSKPVLRIGRIWADGNLLRGSSGDLKVETTFRLHDGHEDQPLDPLIASAEAAGQCPAYRGLAYAVFEDLQLADYGNRIPSLTFEIFERETVVPLNDIFQHASSRAIGGTSNETLVGYALTGSDARAAIAPLLDTFPVMLRARHGNLELLDIWAPSGAISAIEPVAVDGNKNFERPAISIEPPYTMPRSLTLRHYEPERDFQTGLQSSERAGSGRVLQQIDLPAALSAASAKRIAELALLEKQRGRESWIVQSALNADEFAAGQWVKDPSGRASRIAEIEHNRGSSKIIARASLAADPTAAVLASPGRNIGAPDLTPGQTEIAVIDLPIFDFIDPGKSVVGIFANGSGAGWRRAALSVQQGDQLVELGPTAASAIIGRSLSALAPHSPHLLDTANGIDVQLAHDDIEFGPLMQNEAICFLGGEFIRVGTVSPVAAGRYRLTDLQRGCFGTKAAIEGHLVDEQFVWLEVETARLLDGIALSPGSTVTVEALGMGDETPVIAATTVAGRSIAPLSPVHINGRFLPDGGIELSWIRRSRIDFGWNDGVDQAVVEDGERYNVSLFVDGEAINSWTTQESALAITPAIVADMLVLTGPVMTFSITQVGRHMQSAAATIEVATTP